MNESGPAGAARWIGVRRFPDWRAVRQWVLREAGQRAENLLLLVPNSHAAAALREWLRDRAPGLFQPAVRVAGEVFGDLAGDLDPPLRLAPGTAREILLEEALAAEPGAPPGDPAQLVLPLLGLLDEQARDREPDAAPAAFDALAQRARKHFGEARETDAGAARLFELNEWLARVVVRYRASLDALARSDADGIRRRLFAKRRPFRSRFERTRVLALGPDALAPAEARLLAALLPPGQLVFGLAGAADPLLPASLELRDLGDADPARERASARPRRLLVPDSGDGELVFRATDRDGEIRIAATLLRRFRDEGGGRAALVAENPRDYLESAAFLLPDFGFTLRTRFGRPLARQPWIAALGQVLDFAAAPGRLSLGLDLLRGAFFVDAGLAEPPGRAADALAREALSAGIRNTNDPADLPKFATRFRERAARVRERAEGEADPGRTLARAASLASAAAALDTLAAAGAALAPLREPGAGFHEAVLALIAFAEERLADPEAADAGDRDLAFDALRQAAEVAPGPPRSENPDAIGRRIRRLLRGRTLPPEDARDGSPEEVELLAARDAPFGDHDALVLLGVSDADWPRDRPDNIFFPHRVLERATRTRHARRAAEQIRLLRSFVELPGAMVAFTRPELVDGFPAATSPLARELAEAVRESGVTPCPVRIPEPVPAEDAPPLPTALSRRAPAAAVLDRPVSPSGLDTCRENPAQFFAREVLRLEEERPLDDVPPPTDRGEWLHAFLEEAYGRLRTEGIEVTESNWEEILARFREEYRRFAEGRGIAEVERSNEERWLFGADGVPAAMEWFLREEAGRGPAKPVRFEEKVAGELEPATETRPALHSRGRFDRLDERPDGTRRIVEYKSGRFYDNKPLQPRVYARMLEGQDGIATDFALPYFGNRKWIGPDDKPNDEKQDQELRSIADGLGAGLFLPADKDGKFDFDLVTRRDLPHPDPGEPTA